jgi:hypothetical protein
MRRGISYVLAASAYHLAVLGEQGAPPDQQLRAMTTAMVAAYTFLFEPMLPQLGEAPEALDERTNDAREIYNRSMSWLALHHQREAGGRTERFTLPMVSGSLRLRRGLNQMPYPPESATRFDACYALHGVGNELPVIQRGLGARSLGVRACYEVAAEENPKLSGGEITVSFTVEPTGKMINPKIEISTVADAAVEACVLRQMDKMSFPAARESTSARHTFAFSAASSLMRTARSRN